MEALTILQHSSPKYPPRTEENILSSDVTIAIAAKFDSPGEKLTRQLSAKWGKPYIGVNAKERIEGQIEAIIDCLNALQSKDSNELCLNIAGNSLYTLRYHGLVQSVCNQYAYYLLKAIISHPRLQKKIGSIRTGGQTGFDQAGAVAGILHQIPVSILLPKGYRIRNAQGFEQVMSEEQCRERFKEQLDYLAKKGCNIEG